jgi:protein-S-isoprenylcysteine O-methyltransferase
LAIGFFLFSWSVIVRGRYAISWKMPEDHVLVTWGPYGFVRHPSYLSYFIMFIGLFLLWMNLFAAIPLIAIPGYVRITDKEEEMLVERFGELYLQYQKRVNKFFPRLKRREN